MSFVRKGLGLLSRAQHTLEAHAFRVSSRHPAEVQAKKLRAFLRANAGTAYGRAHHYEKCHSWADFQRQVPVASWETVKPFVDRAVAGEQGVLTAEPVTHFERTSGSTSGPKLVPYTQGLLREFHLGVAAWFADVAAQRPALSGTQQYWSLSQAVARTEKTPGGLRIGLEDDTAYVSRLARWATHQLMAVPPQVAKSPTAEIWRTRTLEHLVSARALGFVSVWSPSFFTLLLEELSRNLETYLRVLPETERAGIQRRLSAEGRFGARAIWPQLTLLSCWTDAAAAAQVEPLRALLGDVEIQPKGLLATEGTVSIPLFGVGTVAAAPCHVLEFLDVESPSKTPLRVDELREGAVYSPLLTTGNGFARYRLFDAVRCTGHFRALPILKFEGRLDRVTDLCGEKVNAAEVERVLAQLPAPFRMAVAVEGPPARYVLFLEADEAAVRAAAQTLEKALHENPMYRGARELGQLGALEGVAVRDGWRRYVAHLQARGLKQGDIKPAALERGSEWLEVFTR